MKVTITGNRGEGKTTVAILIARLLKEQGFKVCYNGFDRNAINNIISKDEFKPDLSQDRHVYINDYDTC